MDWENKFNSIVKETEDNLAKAKEKLSSKSSATTGDFYLGTPTAGSTCSKHFQHSLTSIPLPDTLDLNMSTDQILHLQEQINYQARIIEKLQKLIITLNSERDFYKEQMSQLKGEIDQLTDRMSNQFVAASSERQLSTMKRELMREIENVKTMLQNSAQEVSNTKRSSFPPPWNEDFWAVKENLTESLEQVHHELNVMNKRIDRLESQMVADPCGRPRPTSLSKNDHGASQYQRPVLYSPVYKGTEEVSSLDLQQLRQTVNSLNSKLDSFERRIDTTQSQQPSAYSHNWPGNSRHSYIPTSRKNSVFDVGEDDLHSLSDLSDISSLSEINIDDDIDGLTFQLRDGTTSKRETRKKSPVYKTTKAKTGKVEFSFSDSDIDDVDLETDSLDFDN